MIRKGYKSDLSDKEWQIIKPLIPPPKPGEHPRTVDMREVVNAVFYLLRTGCSWEMLPHDFPPYSTVYYYFRRWQRRGLWELDKPSIARTSKDEARQNSWGYCRNC